MAPKYRSLHDPAVSSYLDDITTDISQSIPSPAQAGAQAHNAALQSATAAASKVQFTAPRANSLVQGAIRDTARDAGDRARSEAQFQQDQGRANQAMTKAKEDAASAQADAAESNRKMQVRAGAAAGMKTETDIPTGKRTIALHPDGARVWEAKKLGDPVQTGTQTSAIEVPGEAAPTKRPFVNPLMGDGGGALGATGGTSTAVFEQQIRDDRGNEPWVAPDTTTDAKTGRQYTTKTDPTTGATIKTAVGIDRSKYEEVQWQKQHEAKTRELDMQEIAVKQQRANFDPAFKPVAVEYDEANKELAALPPVYTNQGGIWRYTDPKTLKEVTTYDPSEVERQKTLRDNAMKRHARAKEAHDKMAPNAGRLDSIEKDMAATKLKLGMEKVRRESGLPEDDGGVAEILAGSTAGIPSPVANTIRQSTAEAPVTTEGSPDFVEPPVPILRPESNEEAIRTAYGALRGIEGITARKETFRSQFDGKEGSLTVLERDGKRIGTISDGDYAPTITLTREGREQADIRELANLGATGGAHLYLQRGANRKSITEEATEVSGIFSTVKDPAFYDAAGKPLPALSARLEEMGATPQAIMRRVDNGDLSVQHGAAILKDLYGTTMDYVEPSDEDFQAWRKDTSAKQIEKFNQDYLRDVTDIRATVSNQYQRASEGKGRDTNAMVALQRQYLSDRHQEAMTKPGYNRMEWVRRMEQVEAGLNLTGGHKFKSAMTTGGKLVTEGAIASVLGMAAGAGEQAISAAEGAILGDVDKQKMAEEYQFLRNRSTANTMMGWERNIKAWATPTGRKAEAAMNQKAENIKRAIDSEMGSVAVKAAIKEWQAAALDFQNLAPDEKWPITADHLDPDKDQALKASLAQYMATANPAHFAAFIERGKMSNGRRQLSVELEKKLGTGNEGFFAALEGATYAGWEEVATEVVGDVLTFGLSKGLKLAAAGAKGMGAAGASMRLARASAVASKGLEGAAAIQRLGIRPDLISKPLTALGKASNATVTAVKGTVMGMGTEALEEMIVEAGSDSPDYGQAALGGAIGSIGMAPVSIAMAVGGSQAGEMELATRLKTENSKYAKEYNERNAGIPTHQYITPEIAGVARMFNSEQAYEKFTSELADVEAQLQVPDLTPQQTSDLIEKRKQVIFAKLSHDDNTIEAAREIAAMPDPAEKVFYSGIAKVASGNTAILTQAERSTLQRATTESGQPYFATVNGMDYITDEARADIQSRSPALGALIQTTESQTLLEAQAAQQITPPGTASGAQGDPATGGVVIPPHVSDASGLGVPLFNPTATPSPTTSNAPNLTEMDAGIYEITRADNPSMPEIPAAVAEAYAQGKPVSVSMANQAAKAGVAAPTGYTRQGARLIPPPVATQSPAQAETPTDTLPEGQTAPVGNGAVDPPIKLSTPPELMTATQFEQSGSAEAGIDVVKAAIAAENPFSVAMGRDFLGITKAPEGYIQNGSVYEPERNENVSRLPLTKEQREAGKALAAQVLKALEARTQGAVIRVERISPDRPTGGVEVDLTGKITLLSDDMVSEVLKLNIEDPVAYFTGLTIKHEVMHLAQLGIAREAYKKTNSSKTFDEFFMDYYAELFRDFAATSPNALLIASKRYGQSAWNNSSEGMKGAELFRMIGEDLMDTEQSEILEASVGKRVLEMMQEAIEYLTKLVLGNVDGVSLSKEAKRHALQLAERYSEITGIALSKDAIAMRDKMNAEDAVQNNGQNNGQAQGQNPAESQQQQEKDADKTPDTEEAKAADEARFAGLRMIGRAINRAVESNPQIKGEPSRELEFIADDLMDTLAGMSPEAMEAEFNRSLDEWLESLAETKAAKAQAEEARKTDEKRNKARNARMERESRIRDKARQILNSGNYSALSSVFEKGRIQRKPNAIGLILARKRSGKKLTELEMGMLRNLSEWDGAPTKSEWKGGGNNEIIRAILDYLYAKPGEGQMPGQIADGLIPGVDTSSEMFEAIDKELRALSRGQSLIDPRSPDYEGDAEAIAKADAAAQAAMEAEEAAQASLPTLPEIIAALEEAYYRNDETRNQADLPVKLRAVEPLVDQLPENLKTAFLRAVMEEGQRIHFGRITAIQWQRENQGLSPLTAKIQRVINESDAGYLKKFLRVILTTNGQNLIEQEFGSLASSPSARAEMDSAYLAAVEAGDMETAQRMVDERMANIPEHTIEFRQTYGNLEVSVYGRDDITTPKVVALLTTLADSIRIDTVEAASNAKGQGYGKALYLAVARYAQENYKESITGSASTDALNVRNSLFPKTTVRTQDDLVFAESPVVGGVNYTPKSLAPSEDSDYNVIPRSQRFKPQSDSILFSSPSSSPSGVNGRKAITARFAELTASIPAKPKQADLDAWKDANPQEYAELKAMRERVLRAAGYDVGPVWRGEQEGDRPDTYPRNMRREPGIFTTDEKDVADGYDGEGASREFLLRGPVLDLRGDEQLELSPEGTAFVNRWAEESEWDFVERRTGEEVSPSEAVASGELFDWEGNWSSARWKDLQSTAFQNGFNTVILKDKSGDALTGYMDSYVAKDSESLKSTEPLNTDSNGRLIPPSEWGDTGSPSILFSAPSTGSFDFGATGELGTKTQMGINFDGPRAKAKENAQAAFDKAPEGSPARERIATQIARQEGLADPAEFVKQATQPAFGFNDTTAGTRDQIGLFSSPSVQAKSSFEREKKAILARATRDGVGSLLAPNGKRTNLTDDQWATVRTKSFKNWFGDWEKFAGLPSGVWSDADKSVSKVVDENGEPLVVYHGSKEAGFDVFEPSRSDNKLRPDSIFFSSSRDTARTYSGSRNDVSFNIDEDGQFDPEAAIYAVFLNIRNPNEDNFEGANWDGTRTGFYTVQDADGEQIYSDVGRAYFADEADAEALAEMNEGAEVLPAEDHYASTNSVARDAKQYGNDGAIIREVVDDGGEGDSYDTSDVFVAFKANQVKSAFENNGDFSNNPSILFSSASNQRAFDFGTSGSFSTRNQGGFDFGGSKATPERTQSAPESPQSEQPQGEEKDIPKNTKRDASHLNALELGLSNERERLRNAKTDKEKLQREVWVGQMEREVAGERGFLGLAPATESTEQSDEELLAALGLEGGTKQNVPAPGKITDFGEKIGGARKDYAQTFADAKALDIASEPFSKVWPEPDYAKLVEQGGDPWTVGFIRAMRDEVPTKPRQGWKLSRYVQQVNMLRDMAESILAGEYSKDTIQDLIKSGQYSALDEAIAGAADLYAEVGHGQSLKGIRVAHQFYSLYRGEKNIWKWEVTKRAKATAFSNMPTTIAEGNTREEALERFKEAIGKRKEQGKPKVKFDIYRYTAKDAKPGFIIGKKIGRHHADLFTFETAKEAREYLMENYDDVVARHEAYKKIGQERRTENAPRVGADHRRGRDITPQMFQKAFSFRGVEFGNYVEQKRRQSDLNRAYEALMDLAAILNIPPQALSLDSTLGLAFGARGSGGKNAAAAHYEPGKIAINLTKNNGPGSLAHEWFHAMDNYFLRQVGKPADFATAQKRGTWGGRMEVMEAFGNIIRTIDKSGLRKRSSLLDKKRSSPYWSTDIELSARAFENYVIERLKAMQASNDYLANISDISEYAESMMEAFFDGNTAEDLYPYLTEEETAPVVEAFDNLFGKIQTKPTDRGIALFSSPSPQAVRTYLDSNGTRPDDALRESERVSTALAQDRPGNLAEGGSSYSQGDLFAPGQPAPPSQGKQIAAAGSRALARAKAKTGRDSLSDDLIRGMSGDWAALAREVDAKGSASSILADLINREIPVWNVNGTILDSAEAVHAVMLPIRSPYFESLKVIVLDGNLKAVHSQILTVGTLGATSIHPAEIFGTLARLREVHGKKYSTLVFSHNHPSGDPTPSRDDERATMRINQVAEMAGWNVIDHIVTNGEKFYSFRASGIMVWDAFNETPYTPRKDKGTPAPDISKEDRQAPWEAVKRSELKPMDTPERITEIAKHLRNANPDAAHILYTNTRLNLLAVERVDMVDVLDQEKLARRLIAARGREGAFGFIIDYPQGKSTGAILAERVQKVADMLDIRFLDAVTMTSESRGYESARENGILRETPDSPQQPDAPIITRLQSEIKKQEQIYGEITPSRMASAVQDAAWSLMGDKNAVARQDAMEALTGTRPSKANSGVTQIANSLAKWVENTNQAKTAPTTEQSSAVQSTQPDLFTAATAPDATKKLGDVKAGRMHALAAYRALTAKRAAGKPLTATEEQQLLDAETALGQKMAFDMEKLRGAATPVDKDSLTTTTPPPKALGGTIGGQAEMMMGGETERGGQMRLFSSPASFYSPLERAVEAKIPARATPEQIMATVRAAGVKAEEIKWSGIEQALPGLAVDGKVPKDALLAYLRDEGAVRFEEVTLGGETSRNRAIAIIKENDNLGFDNARQAFDAIAKDYASDPKTLDNWNFNEGDKDKIEPILKRSVDERNTESTKFSQYTLPGGENYREVVLAMPTQLKEPVFERAYQKDNGDYRVEFSDGQYKDIPGWIALNEQMARTTAESEVKRKFTESNYTSSHFPDVPNYVAHMRVDERTLPDGTRTMHAAEYQSDRHQEGRKKGYREEKKTRWYYQVKGEGFQTTPKYFETEEAAIESRKNDPDARSAISPVVDENFKGVAPAPFEKTWPLALFKRHLRNAVAGGFDAVSWDTGETQNDRFDLSKQVDSIAWIKDGTGASLTVMKDGGDVTDDIGLNRRVPLEELPDIIGKEAATKIIEGRRTGKLAGDDLKVGGKGMIGFYDNMLPKEIGKYVKQWNGRVSLYDPTKAQSLADVVVVPSGSLSTPIWKIAITPQMRAGVTGGQALFSSPSRWPSNLYAYTYRKEYKGGETQHIVRTYNERTGLKEDRVFDTLADAQQEMRELDEKNRPINNPAEIAQILGLASSATPEDSTAVDAALASMNPVFAQIYEAVSSGMTIAEVMAKFGKSEQAINNVLNQVRARIVVATRAADGKLKEEVDADGKFVNNRPDLAEGGKAPFAAVDQIRNENDVKPGERGYNTEERRQLAIRTLNADYEGHFARLEDMARNGVMPIDLDVFMAQEIFEQEVISGRINDPTRATRVALFRVAYRDEGTMQSDAFRARIDRKMTPAQRNAVSYMELLYEPSPEVRARIKEAKKDKPTQDAILKQWMDKINAFKAVMKAEGRDIDASIKAFADREANRKQAEADNPRTAEAIGQAYARLTEREKVVVEAIRSGSKYKHAGELVSMTAEQAEAVYRKFRSDVNTEMKEAGKRFMARSLASSPTDSLNSLLIEIGLPDPDLIAVDDADVPRVEALRKEREPKPPKPAKPKKTKAEEMLGVGDKPLTDKQKAAIERFVNAPPSTWKVIRQETGKLFPQAEGFPESYEEGENARRILSGLLLPEPINETTGTFDMADPAPMAHITNRWAAENGSWINKFIEWHKMAILSGPQTILINASGGLNIAHELTTRRAVEAAWNDIMGMFGQSDVRSATLSEFLPMVKQIRAAMKLAAKHAISSWKLQQPVYDKYVSAGAIQADWVGPGAEFAAPALETRSPKQFMANPKAGDIPKMLNWFLKAVTFRELTMVDEFWKTMYGQLDAAAQAHRMAAKEEKLSGKAYSDRVKELMEPGSVAWMRTISRTKNATFQNQLAYGKWTREDSLKNPDHKEGFPMTWEQAKKKSETESAWTLLDAIAAKAMEARKTPFLGPLLHMFALPFIVTPKNIIQRGLEVTPLGAVIDIIDGMRSLKRRMHSGQITKEESNRIAGELYNKARFVQTLTNQSLGLMIYFAVESLSDDDDEDEYGRPTITGTLPWSATKKGERDTAMAVMPPQSIRIGDTIIPYGRIEPFATTISAIVDMAVSQRRNDTAFNSQVLTDMVVGFKSQLTDKTMLKGLGDLLRVAEDPKRGADRLAASMLTGFVPNIVRQPIRELDPVVRDKNPQANDGFLTAIGKRIGYELVPQSAPPKYSIWGEEISSAPGKPLANSVIADGVFRIFDPLNVRFGVSSDINPIDAWIRYYNDIQPTSSTRIGIEVPDDEITIPIPGEKPRKIALTEAEKVQRIQNVGKAAKAFLMQRNWGVKTTLAQDAEQKAKLIKDTFSRLKADETKRIKFEKIASSLPVSP